MDLWSATILLFLILDPLGNVPIFLSVLARVDPARRVRVLVRELLIALAFLVLFLAIGRELLGLLGLRQESVSVAGGIVLFLIGVRMIFPGRHGVFGKDGDGEGEPFIVPLAVPCVAGPSVLAALLLLSNSQPERFWTWGLALLIAWSLSAMILLSASTLNRWLGRSALTALERLMGMVLVALSVQMILDGVVLFLRGAGVAG